MQKWRDRLSKLAVNLGLLAAMWLLDRVGVLPRLYPRFDNGVPMSHDLLVPTGLFLVALTAVWGLLMLWEKVAASAKAAPQLRPADD